MKHISPEELKALFDTKLFHLIGDTADELGLECYVVGGYVRDLYLERPSKDIDVVVVGSGIAMAEAQRKRLGRGAHVSIFRNFGTAQLKWRDMEVEFVGARKESYTHDSRKPIVEDGTLGTTRTAATSPSMRLPYASMQSASVSSPTPSTDYSTWRTASYARRSTPT